MEVLEVLDLRRPRARATCCAGAPSQSVRGGTTVRGVTSAPAPMNADSPTSAPSSTVARMPISAPCRIDRAVHDRAVAERDFLLEDRRVRALRDVDRAVVLDVGARRRRG